MNTVTYTKAQINSLCEIPRPPVKFHSDSYLNANAKTEIPKIVVTRPSLNAKPCDGDMAVNARAGML